MFSLGIRYLMGWAMAAADGAKKEQVEWPPHPDRVFMALAAAWFETGQTEEEGEALRWLEKQPAPAIAASGHYGRERVTHYVPVNDATLSTAKTIQGLAGKAKVALAALKDAGLAQLPEYRSRQPRSFPVALLHDPVVHLIWDMDIPVSHREPLQALCRKVGAIGHSASLAQLWLDPNPPLPNWQPASGLAQQRMRVFGPGRLAYLEQRMNRRQWLDYHDLQAEIEQAEADLAAMAQPPRAAWKGFPDLVLLAAESATKQHAAYHAAKTGGAAAATDLVQNLVDAAALERVRQLIEATGGRAGLTLVSAHAYEREGINAIPAALAEYLSETLEIPYETGIVQINVVSHTGADGYGRLARQAQFDGPVVKGRRYLLVDDFVGQGGTLANLRGFILKKGGMVAGGVCLTGKPYSARLALDKEQLDDLRNTHDTFESWWKQHFGHAFDRLTQSEARYLARSPDVDEIRDRIAAAKRTGGGGSSSRDPGEQQRFIAELKSRLDAQFPAGKPASLRPEPGLWQGYAPVGTVAESPAPSGVFDTNLVVLALQGKRLSLPATLKLTETLRAALLSACPDPIPEWLSGHAGDGRPSQVPHLALLPLPFVGDAHADGRVLGVALALPRSVSAEEVGRVLGPWLQDEWGQPVERKLFAGQWLECRVALENREKPPLNLRPETWIGPARRWASVTPVVLDRHFDGTDKWEKAAESVKDAVERIGLPRPLEVLLHPVSLHAGVPRSNEFPWMTRKKDGGRMHHAHAVLVFAEDVQGPVLAGAGRFRGYGLFRPLKQGCEHD